MNRYMKVIMNKKIFLSFMEHDREIHIRVAKGIPKGFKLVRIFENPFEIIEFIIEHESFDLVEEGKEPLHNIMWHTLAPQVKFVSSKQ